MTRPRGRPGRSSNGELKRLLLEAAANEFARAGYEGARIEAVATAAGCNRALVYHYFGDKAGLFEAVLGEAADYRSRQMSQQPTTLAEGLIYWFGQNLAEPRRIRLIMQEALAERPDAEPTERRKEYLDRQLAVVRAFQARGLLRDDMDPRHLLTMFLALTSFPACFPRVASVSLDAKDDVSLAEAWASCLADIADMLSPPAVR